MNSMIPHLRMYIPTGYDKQMKFYKQNLERLVNDPTSKTSLNNIIGTLILMCYDQTEKDLNDLVQERLVEEETLESEVNELVYAFNKLVNLKDYDKEQQSKRILFSYLIALNISEMIKLFPVFPNEPYNEMTTFIKWEDE